MKKQTIFMDLGELPSCGSSLMCAILYAKSTQKKCYFVTTENNLQRLQSTDGVVFVDIVNIEDTIDYLVSSLVIDFTQPGKGVSKTALLFQESYNFYLQQDISFSQNSFAEKVEYLETVSGAKELLSHLPSQIQTPVLTYSAEYAALLNLQGIPTIELCYRFKKPGSFMPGSLIVFGDTFSLLRKDDIQLIFEFYQSGRIEDVFINKAVLEVDWDLLYFKMDRSNGSIVPCKYPISDTEAFLDRFMRSFFLQPTSRSFSLDLVMESAQKLDTIDLEMTLDFLRKTLSRCQLDLDRNQYPLTQSHWNWVRPYADCYSKNKLTVLKHTLQQALLGLDLFSRIQERQKRVVSMH
ncbi:hypothetical protein K2X05_02475 [bacterium]|nr:hypothetical protein [bacterium]